MLLTVARFEFRYVLRNPLLWLTVVVTFGGFLAAMSVDGFDLGNEGGLLKNAAYATLRNYVMVSVLFMFVTTAFVANAVLRDDETGFGPIIRSTPVSKGQYLGGRFLGAFGVAALCLLVVPLASLLGSVMPWSPAAQVGPNRLADHLYGYFLVGLPNLFIHGAVFFALATVTRSMMAAYLGVVGFVAGFFILQTGFVGQTAVAVAEPFAGRALKDAVRYWTVAQRNGMLPDLTGGLLYNRLLWGGIAILALAVACAAYRFADQGMSKRERKRLTLVQPSPAEAARAVEAVALPAPEHGARALRALLWMRTRFEVRQVVLSPAFVVVMAWGLFTSVYVLLTRDTAGRPTYPTTLTLIPNIKDAFGVILLVIAMFYAGELVWRERDRRVHEIVDATPIPSWAYVAPKTLAMALVLMGMVLTNVAAAVVFQLSLGFTEVELGKYLLWYVLPATWDALLLAALAVFVQALSPHKTIGWAVMVVFLLWQQFNKAIDHNLLNYGSSPGMPLSDMNGAGSFWRGAWAVRLYWGAFAVLLLVAAHLLWRRGTEVRLRPRLVAARRRLREGPGWVAGAALAGLAATGAYAFYNINVLNAYRSPLAGLTRTAALETKYWKHRDLPQPTVAAMTVSIELYPDERRAVTRGRYLLRNLTSQPIPDVHLRLLHDDLELTNAAVAGARLAVDDREHDYRIYRLDAPMQPGEERVLTFETRRWHRGFRNGSPNTRLVENGTFLDNHEITPVIGGICCEPLLARQVGLTLSNPGELFGPVLLWRAVAERRVRRDRVVVSDPGGQHVEDRLSAAPVGAADVVALERVDEGLGHAVRLRARHRRGDRREVEALGRADRVERRIDRAVVAEPLDRRVGPVARPEARRHRVLHELLDVARREVVGCGHRRQALAVVAVECEADLDVLAVPARDLEHVTAPPLVRDRALDLPGVGPAGAPPRVPRERPAVDVHHAPDPLQVVARVERAVHERVYPAGPVGGARPNHLPDLRYHDAVIGLRVARASRRRIPVHGRAADPEHSTDGRHLAARQRLDAPYQCGFFLTSSRAAWRISTSMAFLPTRRSNSRMRCWAARSSLAGTTSSFAATAVVLPRSARCFHRRTTDCSTWSSRLSSASVSSFRSTRPICSRLNSGLKIRRPSVPRRCVSTAMRPVLQKR